LGEPIKKGILLVFDRPPSKIPVKKEPSKFSKLFRKILPIIYFGFVGLLSLFCIFMMIVNLFKQKGVWLGFVYLFSVIGMLVVLLCIIWLIISFFETDIWKMIKGMGYSVKNKVCPIIKWDK
jgi:hypothetical protein